MTDNQINKLYSEPQYWLDRINTWKKDRKRAGRVSGYQLKRSRILRENYLSSQERLAIALRDDSIRAKLMMKFMMEN